MIFSVLKSELLSRLNLLNRVLPTRSTKPVAECILLELKDNTLKLTANDLSKAMVSEITVQGKEDGVALVIGKKFWSIIKELPEGTIELKKEDNTLKVISDKIKFELAVNEDIDEFPQIPEALDKNKITINSVKLKKYIEKTSFAASTDELRAVLTGVLFSLKNNELTMVATDSVRMVRLVDKGIKNEGISADLILPAKSLDIIKDAIDKNFEAKIFFEDNYIQVKLENTTIFSRLINGKYPAYQAIIPVDNDIEVAVDKDIIVPSINLVSIACNPLTRLIKTKFENNSLLIAAEDTNTQSKAEKLVNIDYAGEKMAIGFNASKLVDLFKNVDTDKVNLKIKSPQRPVIIKPADESPEYDILMLLMPVKLEEE